MTIFRETGCGRAEDDLDDELRFHLERAVELHVARGLSVREARWRARLAFGSIDAIKDDCRQAWGLRLVDDVAQDLRFGARRLWRNPGFAVGSLFIVASGVARGDRHLQCRQRRFRAAVALRGGRFAWSSSGAPRGLVAVATDEVRTLAIGG